jgi:glycosyltransferase involved in cell wall biosynthesis
MLSSKRNYSTAPKTSFTPLTVAHVVEGCQGGVGSAVRHLIEAQNSDPEVGEIHLITDLRRMGDMLVGVHATVHEYESSRSALYLIKVSQGLHKRLHSIAPDVVYLHSTFPGLYGRLRWKQEAVPWTTIYCAHGWAFTQQLSFLKKKCYAAVERVLASRADAIVSISYAEFDAASKAHVLAPLHRVIYHGVPERNVPVPAPVRVDPSRINLVFIGRFDLQKGLDILLSVINDPQLKHITLWLIGGATLGDGYSIPEQDNIKLIGWVPNSQIDDYIQCFDGVIIPSRWEGFGLIALEAMRNGKPALASRTGGLSELVIDGVNGRLFNAADQNDLLRVLREVSKTELTCMGRIAADIFHLRFRVGDCYARWKEITRDALTQRMKINQLAVATRPNEPIAILPLEEL